MYEYKCIRKCFRDGRIYEVGDTLRCDADQVTHFKRTGAHSPGPRAPAVPRRRKKTPAEKDILE